MKKQERILKRIDEHKEVNKRILKMSFYNSEEFYRDGVRYINAIKEGRMICNIDTVSSSGMSRTIKFLSCEKSSGTYRKNWYNYLNYFAFFKIMGFSPKNKDSHYFRIHGCGMDMIFHTNYTIMYRLHDLGFISRKQLELLAQETPPII